MRVHTIETVTDGGAGPAGPVELHMTFSHWSQWVRGACLMLVGAGLAAPFGLLAATHGGLQQIVALGHDNPLASVQLGFLFALAVAALAGGSAQLAAAPVSNRIVRRQGCAIEVQDTVRGKQRTWRALVGEFRGVRHRVFTTSSGAVHVLLLEHPVRARSVQLASAANISDAMVADAAQHYGLPVLTRGGQAQDAESVGAFSGAMRMLRTAWPSNTHAPSA